MNTLALIICVALLTPCVVTASSGGATQPPLKPRSSAEAILAAVAPLLGQDARITVELLDQDTAVESSLVAVAAPGARFGRVARFVLTPDEGRPFSVRARVDATVRHAVAATAIPRGQQIDANHLAWRDDQLIDVPLQALPALEMVLGAQAKRAIAAGELFTRSALGRPPAVRAGDIISITWRAGAFAATGTGRAVSSGAIGDVIRMTRPGSRDIKRGRIIAPSAVEMLQ